MGLDKQSAIEGRLLDLKENTSTLLVGVYFSTKEKEKCKEHIDELASLCDTYGLEAEEPILCPLKKIESSTYLGSGKVDEIAKLCSDKKIAIVIFDDEIAPHQQRNLEKIFQIPVIDRTELILGVFQKHAETKEAKIQVELAQLRYQMPRLKRMWTHLSRQRVKGKGGGYLKGEGERQIEIDRRIIKRKIAHLQKQLIEIKKHREVQRIARKRSNIPSFAVIGYTNAGKSTLLNALTNADVLVADKLFATLDTITRKFLLPNSQEILLIDTVGFIRKIPHMLIAAFKSTLEEAIEADILIHLIDVSQDEVEEKALATFEILKELKAEERPMITCLNKCDVLEDKNVIFKLHLAYPKTVEISALKKEGLDDLINSMIEHVSLLRKKVKLLVPQSKYSIISEVMEKGHVLSCEYIENDVLLYAEIPSLLEHKIKDYIQKD